MNTSAKSQDGLVAECRCWQHHATNSRVREMRQLASCDAPHQAEGGMPGAAASLFQRRPRRRPPERLRRGGFGGGELAREPAGVHGAETSPSSHAWASYSMSSEERLSVSSSKSSGGRSVEPAQRPSSCERSSRQGRLPRGGASSRLRNACCPRSACCVAAAAAAAPDQEAASARRTG